MQSCLQTTSSSLQDTQPKFYFAVAVPVLLYGREAWGVTSRDGNRLQAEEMRFLRAVRGYKKQKHLKNEDVRQELTASVV
jgi:hypothetical protein